MRVEKLGDGDPECSVVACVHGNETCGYRAIQKFKNSDYSVKQPVNLIVANNRARKREERFIEDDLNRCFPGNSSSEVYEEKIAQKILREVKGTTVLDLHSTHSEPTPFAFFAGEENLKHVEKSGVKRAVDLSCMPETMINYTEGISVECGKQGSDTAAERAYRIMLNFLAAEEVIERKHQRTDPEVFEVYDEVKGSGYRFKAENFSKVEQGEVFAEKGSEKIKADEEFHPVLMSTNGYNHKIGYKGRKVK